MLTLSNLNKSYSTQSGRPIKALNDISLQMDKGMFGLLGPNGAGKSSLMRTLATLQSPDSGAVIFNGKNILHHPKYMRSKLGYLPQDFGVYPGVSAYDLMNYIAKLKGMNKASQRHDQILTLLDEVNLSEHKGNAVNSFSGGMKQRFGIAQALLNEPEILIVDEPMAGLDPEERNRFHNILAEISNEKLVILSTHIVEDISNLCSEMAILQSGTVIKHGKPKHLIEEINNKIWAVQATEKQIIEKGYEVEVISQKLTSGIMSTHVYCDTKPDTQFYPVKPDLEDAYFTALKKNGPICLSIN